MENENLLNMERCPSFESCSIPLCPLDKYMKERTELSEEEQCPLRKIITKGKRKKRVRGHISQKMRGILSFVRERNKEGGN